MPNRKVITLAVVLVLVSILVFVFKNAGILVSSRVSELQAGNRSRFDSINHEITLDKMFYDSAGKLNEKGEQYMQKSLQKILISNDTSLDSPNKAARYIMFEMYDEAIPELKKATAADSEFVYALVYAFEKNKQSDSAKFYYTIFSLDSTQAKKVRLRLDSLTSLYKKKSK